jgi:hypothetical protein
MDFYNSRKAQAFLVAVVVACFGKAVNMTEDQISEIVQVAMVYILGRAIHDHGQEKK